MKKRAKEEYKEEHKEKHKEEHKEEHKEDHLKEHRELDRSEEKYREQQFLALRAKNLIWTVSGDHSLKLEINEKGLGSDKNRCLYEAMKLGAAARWTDIDGIMLYSLKKGYVGADEARLQSLISICLDSALFPVLKAERSGTEELCFKAYDSVLEDEFDKMSLSELGRLEYAFMMSRMRPGRSVLHDLEEPLRLLNSLGGVTDASEIIRVTDELYNTFVDREFGKKNCSLEDVLSVTIQEMIDDKYIKGFDRSAYINDMLNTASRPRKDEKLGERTNISVDAVEMDAETVESLKAYTDVVFGKSALTQTEAIELGRAVCTDLHRGRRIHVTRGLLEDTPVNNIHYKVAERHMKHNEMTYHNRHRVVKLNISRLAYLLRRSLLRRTEPDEVMSRYGRIVPSRLWQVSKIEDPKLFNYVIPGSEASFVVDILVDGSGSQAGRQGLVAVQAYILSAALSEAGIPHRTMSYCTMYDATVLHRFRDFDDARDRDWKCFQYIARSSNRDGLAIRAAVNSLLKRTEDEKILIILSDGKPNDVSVQRGFKTLQTPYVEDTAIEDTAKSVRQTRERGISVLGVFCGSEDELEAERRIFGKDFAYIRDIAYFSQVVGKYLERCIDRDYTG